MVGCPFRGNTYFFGQITAAHLTRQTFVTHHCGRSTEFSSWDYRPLEARVDQEYPYLLLGIAISQLIGFPREIFDAPTPPDNENMCKFIFHIIKHSFISWSSQVVMILKMDPLSVHDTLVCLNIVPSESTWLKKWKMHAGCPLVTKALTSGSKKVKGNYAFIQYMTYCHGYSSGCFIGNNSMKICKCKCIVWESEQNIIFKSYWPYCSIFWDDYGNHWW